jgi:hypothetical protein
MYRQSCLCVSVVPVAIVRVGCTLRRKHRCCLTECCTCSHPWAIQATAAGMFACSVVVLGAVFLPRSQRVPCVWMMAKQTCCVGFVVVGIMPSGMVHCRMVQPWIQSRNQQHLARWMWPGITLVHVCVDMTQTSLTSAPLLPAVGNGDPIEPARLQTAMVYSQTPSCCRMVRSRCMGRCVFTC